MLRIVASLLVSLVLTFGAYAHELTPTYPELKPSYLDGLSKVTITLFNRRPEVGFYEIGVFDADWKKVDFATTYKILEIKYLQKKNIEVFVKNGSGTTYVCTTSKLTKENTTATVVMSRVCSKIK